MNQVNAINNQNKKYSRGSKGWWDTANRITGRKNQGIPIRAVICPEDMNTYFQSLCRDKAYEAPEPLHMPYGTRVPKVDEQSVLNFLIHQKRTAPGVGEFPYWFWRDYAYHLAPIITNIFNSCLKHQTFPLLWKPANVSPIPKESPLNYCNQLRPISLTNIIMRIFERLGCKQEISSLLKPPIGSDQFA